MTGMAHNLPNAPPEEAPLGAVGPDDLIVWGNHSDQFGDGVKSLLTLVVLSTVCCALCPFIAHFLLAHFPVACQDLASSTR